MTHSEFQNLVTPFAASFARKIQCIADLMPDAYVVAQAIADEVNSNPSFQEAYFVPEDVPFSEAFRLREERVEKRDATVMEICERNQVPFRAINTSMTLEGKTPFAAMVSQFLSFRTGDGLTIKAYVRPLENTDPEAYFTRVVKQIMRQAKD